MTEETGFLSSLEYLGSQAESDVIDELEAIAARGLSWEDFVRIHGWLRVELRGLDTYPGADPLYWFALSGKSGAKYQIAAKGPYGHVVVCAVVAA